MLTWKKGLPTQPGYYWFRNSFPWSVTDDQPRIELVRDYAGALAIGNSSLIGLERFEAGEWAGPPAGGAARDKGCVKQVRVS